MPHGSRAGLILAAVLVVAWAMPAMSARASSLSEPSAESVYYPTPEALALDALGTEREQRFADVADSVLTTAEVAQVIVGPVEYLATADFSRIAEGVSIFAAVEEINDYACVPLMLGDRRVAEIGCSLTSKGWECSSTGGESPAWDGTRRTAMSRLRSELGGEPEAIRRVSVLGSQWLLAKRGSREAAAFIAYYSYGCTAGGSDPPELGEPGDVLSAQEYRTLMGRLQRYESDLAYGWLLPTAMVALAVAVTGAIAWAIVRSRRRRTEPALPADSGSR